MQRKRSTASFCIVFARIKGAGCRYLPILLSVGWAVWSRWFRPRHSEYMLSLLPKGGGGSRDPQAKRHLLEFIVMQWIAPRWVTTCCRALRCQRVRVASRPRTEGERVPHTVLPGGSCFSRAVLLGNACACSARWCNKMGVLAFVGRTPDDQVHRVTSRCL